MYSILHTSARIGGPPASHDLMEHRSHHYIYVVPDRYAGIWMLW
jgi:hypothetical protein